MNTQVNGVGRPRQPLSVGQRIYARRAYSKRLYTQLDLAAKLNVALPRVHRFLVEEGLHVPPRRGSRQHQSAVLQAVRLYEDGRSIRQILEITRLPVSELYKGLRKANVPLRTRK